MASYLVNVPKLRGRENYGDWAFAAENLLVLEGLSSYLKPEVSVSETAAADDAKAKAKLILTIDPSLYVHIKEATNTKDLWSKLKSMFDDAGFSRRISLLRNLISIRLESSDTMTSYISQIIETAQRLSGTGFKVNDEWVGCLLLAGLPEKYFPMIMAIEHSGIAITADVVKSKLIDLAGNDSEVGNALFSQRQNYKVGSTERKKSYVQNGVRISSPMSEGQKNNEEMKAKSNIKCYRCKQFGHYRSQCKQLNLVKKSNAFSAFQNGNNYTKSSFYLDSGASVHMVNENMVDIVKNACYKPVVKEIMAANGRAMPVLCSGAVDIVTITPDCKYEVTLKDAVCVPNLETNLISISQLLKNGNRVEFTPRKCHVFNKINQLVAVANEINGVYKLEIQQSKCLFTPKATCEQWHRRLGHINMSDLAKMKEGAVKGISYNDKGASLSKSTCTVCCEGKQSRLPFGQGTRSSEVLDTIHADVCGPMETISIGGSSCKKKKSQ